MGLTHACPTCRTVVPVGVLYGNCAACRSRRADLRRRFLATLDRIAAELADGVAA